MTSHVREVEGSVIYGDHSVNVVFYVYDEAYVNVLERIIKTSRTFSDLLSSLLIHGFDLIELPPICTVNDNVHIIDLMYYIVHGSKTIAGMRVVVTGGREVLRLVR